MVKLTKDHLIYIINMTLEGMPRVEISESVPVSRQHVSKIINDLAYSEETASLRDTLGAFLTDEIRNGLKGTGRAGRELKNKFINHARETSATPKEAEQRIDDFINGYSVGYNQGRQRK